MALIDRTRSRHSPTSLLRWYGADLGRWAGGIASRYATEVAIIAVGGLFVLVAVGFGVGAAFRFIEARYDAKIAFATVGGSFLIVGTCCVLVGLLLRRRPTPPLPRPYRQVEAFKRSVTLPALIQVFANDRQGNVVRRDSVMQMLVGAAAVLVVGWMAASALSRSSRAHPHSRSD